MSSRSGSGFTWETPCTPRRTFCRCKHTGVSTNLPFSFLCTEANRSGRSVCRQAQTFTVSTQLCSVCRSDPPPSSTFFGLFQPLVTQEKQFGFSPVTEQEVELGSALQLQDQVETSLQVAAPWQPELPVPDNQSWCPEIKTLAQVSCAADKQHESYFKNFVTCGVRLEKQS